MGFSFSRMRFLADVPGYGALSFPPSAGGVAPVTHCQHIGATAADGHTEKITPT